MIEIAITPKDYMLADLMVGLQMTSQKIFPRTFKAYKMSAQLIQYTWKSYAMGSTIKGSAHKIKNPKGSYARSIKMLKFAPLGWEISSDNPIAKYLEDGTKEYDMKNTHPYGKRSRMGKNGDPYLIIPLRHGTPGSKSNAPMPEQVYERIRAMSQEGIIKSSTISPERGKEENFWGDMIKRAEYNWGSRLTGMDDENLEGMMVMDVPSGKEAGRSTYLTFRIISVNSPAHKWIQKARPAMNITKYVVNNTRPIIEELIKKGLMEDLGI